MAQCATDGKPEPEDGAFLFYKVPLRPNRSAIRPAGTSSAAKTIVYPFKIHDTISPASFARVP